MARKRGGYDGGILGLGDLRRTVTPSAAATEFRRMFVVVGDAPPSRFHRGEDPADAFENIAALNQITDLEIVRRRHQQAALANVCAYGLFVFVLMAIDTLITDPPGGGTVIRSVQYLCLAALCFALQLKSSLGAHQLRARRLDGVSAVLRHPLRLLPPFKLRALLSAVLFGVMICFPDMASASTLGDITASRPDDWWLKMLGAIFPPVGPLSGLTADTNTTALESVFQAFNSILCAVGAAWLAYHLIGATIQTAHYGKVLGPKGHTTIAPMRVMTGIGLLTPAIKGMCMAQILALYVAVWGGNFASVAWGLYASSLTAPQLVAPALPATTTLTNQILELETCYAFQHEMAVGVFQVGGSAVGAMISNVPASWPSAQAGTNVVDNVSLSVGNAINAVTAAISGSSYSASSSSHRVNVTWDYGACGRLEGVFAFGGGDSAVVAFDKARMAAIDQARAIWRDAVTPIAATLETTSGDRYTAATYTAALTKAVSAALSVKSTLNTGFTNAANTLINTENGGTGSASSFATAASKYGWVTAGTYFMTAANLQSAASYLASQIPTQQAVEERTAHPAGFDPTRLDVGTVNYLADLDSALSATETTWKETDAIPDLTKSVLTGNVNNKSSSGASGILSIVGKQIETISQNYLSGTQSIGVSDSPIVEMSKFGNDIINMIYGLLFAGGLISLATGGIAGVATAAASVASGGFAIVGALVGGLFLIGVEHAYVLPMLVYVGFLFSVIQCLLIVVEAVIATPVWALMHIRFDGDDFVAQHQAAGYSILFNLFLRPVITVMSLMLSVGVMSAGIWLLNHTFIAATIGATGGGMGVTGGIVFALMEGFLAWRIVVFATSIPQRAPEQVARWFGVVGAEGSHGQGGDSPQFIAGAVGKVGGGKHGLKKIAKPGSDGENQAAGGGRNEVRAAEPSSRGGMPA